MKNKKNSGLRAYVLEINNVDVNRSDEKTYSGFNRFLKEVVEHVRSRYTLDEVKNETLFKAYRDFSGE